MCGMQMNPNQPICVLYRLTHKEFNSAAMTQFPRIKEKLPLPAYLHVAILLPVGEDVAVDVSKRGNPGQN